MNLPNKLTVLRIIMVPFFVFFMLTDTGGAANKWIALVIFCAASLTDMLDGKIARARKAIRDLQMEQERITVPKLMKMTGLSRGFFYKNPIIRKEMDDAVQNQAGLIDPRRAIIDRAMEGRLELLEQQVRELQRENEELKKRNAKLQKAVDRKDLNFIKNL